MTEDRERAKVRAWVRIWQQAGPLLEEQRKKTLRHISTPEALKYLSGAFESSRLRFKPKPYSGLIEQQRWFARLRP